MRVVTFKTIALLLEQFLHALLRQLEYFIQGDGQTTARSLASAAAVKA